MRVTEINRDELENIISTSEKKVVVELYTPWCGLCKIFAEIFEETAAAAPDCEFYKINAEAVEDVAEKHNISKVPAMLVFENGKLKMSFVWLVAPSSKEELMEIIYG